MSATGSLFLQTASNTSALGGRASPAIANPAPSQRGSAFRMETQDTAPDTSKATTVHDHDFDPPPDQPWARCRKCGLAQPSHSRCPRPYIPTAAPAPPPTLPPGARPVERGEPPEDEEVSPLPVPEIGVEQYEELAPTPHEMICWRCGAKDNVRQLENGAILCPGCVEILKP